MNNGSDSVRFDPYHKWLGIPPHEHPIHHYRLLGVDLFEADHEVIAAAADRQMAHIKAFVTGPYASQSQQLLNELSKARVCLLNEKVKEVYDKQLLQQLTQRVEAATARVAPRPAPVQPATRTAPCETTQSPITVTFPTTTSSAYRSVRKKSRRGQPLWMLSLYVLSGITFAAVGWKWYANRQSPLPHVVVDSPNTPPPATGSSSPKPPVSTRPMIPVTGNHATTGTTPPSPQRPITTSPTTTLGRPVVTRPPSSTSPFARPNTTVGGGQTPLGVLPGATNNRRASLSDTSNNALSGLASFVSIDPTKPSPTVIGDLGIDPDNVADLSLKLISPEFANRTSTLTIHRADSTFSQDDEWHVVDVSPQQARSLFQKEDLSSIGTVGTFRLKDGILSFEWPAGVTTNDAQRLQLSILQLEYNGQQHHLQFIAPVEEEEPIVIGNWNEVFEHRVSEAPLASWPPESEIRLRVHLLKGFPTTKVVNGNADRLAVEEKLLLSFSTVDYAGLGVFWESKGKIIQVNVAPGFRLLSYPDELAVLSRVRLDRAEKSLTRDKLRAEREYRSSVAARKKLSSNLTAAQNTNITLPGGGTTVQLRNQKSANIAKAQAAINANEARIRELTRLAPLVKQDETLRLPALRELASNLEGNAAVGMELYVPVGNQEITLYSIGLGSEEPSVSLFDHLSNERPPTRGATPANNSTEADMDIFQ